MYRTHIPSDNQSEYVLKDPFPNIISNMWNKIALAKEKKCNKVYITIAQFESFPTEFIEFERGIVNSQVQFKACGLKFYVLSSFMSRIVHYMASSELEEDIWESFFDKGKYSLNYKNKNTRKSFYIAELEENYVGYFNANQHLDFGEIKIMKISEKENIYPILNKLIEQTY